MSTRANIVIKDTYNKIWFYRHNDGYPEGTLPTLKKFVQLIKNGKIRNNVPQSSGWLVIIGALEYRNAFFRENWETLNPSNWKVGSYEITTKQHEDIDYLYIIDIDKHEIEIYHHEDKIETIKV